MTFSSLRSVLPANADIADGELLIGGVRCSELAATYGTPVMVYDEQDVIDSARAYLESFADWPAGTLVAYACKALCTTGVLSLLAAEGLGADVASGGELAIALAAGVPAERMVLHGNNKSRAELEAAVEAGVSLVVLDAPSELELLAEVATAAGRVQDVLVRVNPDIEVETHRYINTAHAGSKFGVDPEVALTMLERARQLPSLSPEGVHVHLGSQLLDVAPWRNVVAWLGEFAARAWSDHGVRISTLDIGGGIGIAYTSEDQPLDVREWAGEVRELVEQAWSLARLELPRLVLEPGRSIVGRAGVTVYEVGVVKHAGGIDYVAVDGGMSDNLRPALYQARYSCLLANRAGEPASGEYWIAGKHCESGDVLIEDAPLPTPRAGDLLAVAATGAYTASMASNYNALTRPPIVLARAGAHRQIVRRETFEDLLARETALERVR